MTPPKFSSLTYAAVWHTCQTLSNLLYRTEIEGLEHIPRSGPFLLACNHASFLDPPIAGSFLPRELHYFARKTLFKGALGKLITRLNAIPIDRDGDSDLGAFRKVFGALKAGHALIVFPEGTRSPDGQLAPARSGVGMIVCRAEVPVVPMRIFGNYEIWRRERKLPSTYGDLRIGFAAPLSHHSLDPGRDHPDRYQEAANRIMAAIANIPRPQPPAV